MTAQLSSGAREWKPDGIGCGGQYLATSHDNLYAGVHDHGSFVQCNVWTPGCGFSPRSTTHDSVEAAKAHAESELRALDPVHFAARMEPQS